jgi:hypothetical protein
MSDSELRQALVGTWRLVSVQATAEGTVVKPFSDNPRGYLVYTADGHVVLHIATRAERSWLGPEVLELSSSQQMVRTRLRVLLRHV